MGEVATDQYKTPLLEAQPINQSPLIRSGNVWTAIAHIITGVLGSGVLSLSWSTAQLGWIAGPLTMLCFAMITLFSAFLLCNCYRSPDPIHGPVRNRSYLEAVRMYLGEMNAWVCGFFVQVSLYGFATAYTVTSGISMRAIQKSNCYHTEGHEAACEYGDTSYMLLFGVVQIVLSQVPDFHNIKWLSVVAAFMSFAYSFIGLGLGIATVIVNGYAKGSVKGITAPTSEKVWLISQAIGDIAFAYPYSIILIEIQDTLKSPPAENKTMKKASTIAIVVTTFFYLCCGSFGYAAFGDDTPGNLLTALCESREMGRIPCCVKRGQWTPEEDNKLSSYIAKHGTRNWRLIPKNAGLQRCGKSCRLRWTNYLHPDLKHGEFSKEDEQTIIKIHSIVGNRWSIIAARLPGRTDNDVKNHWNTKLKKQLTGMGIDPVTHKPISHLIAEISNTLEPPHVAHLAEAALGCFKDEMVHLLTKMHIDFQLQQSNTVLGNTTATYINSKQEENDQSIEKIKFGLSRAMHEPDMLPSNKFWDSNGTPFTNFSGNCSAFPLNVSGFQHGTSSFSNEESGSPWNQSLCTGSSYTAGERQVMQYKVKENGENSEGGKEIRNVPTMFNSDSVLWDLPSDDLMNPLM